MNDYENYALVYLVTRGSGHRGNLFILTIEDAMKLCEDECSHGTGRGGPWMFMWTTIDHFKQKCTEKRSDAIRQQMGTNGKLRPFVFIRDTGKQDADFERLGIHKPNIVEIKRIMSELGYEVKYKAA